MKNKKFILLILVTLLFTGCSVKYDLSINSDLTVNEKVTASDTSTSVKTKTGMEPTAAANSLYDFYKIDGVDYSFSTVEGNNSVTSTASTSFKSLEEYENYFKSDVIKEVNITKKDSYITLDFKQEIPLNNYSSKSLIYDSIEVNIDVPFKVTEHNADSVKGNTYTWLISKNDKLKSIKITFDSNETKQSKKINFGFFEINVKYSVLLITGFVLLILITVVYIYTKNKKNNRF